MPVPNTNIFDGKVIPEDATLTPSDGTAAGSSAVVAGLGTDIDVVVSVINPDNVPVQMYWSGNGPYVWAALGASSTNSQQTPMRLREGMAYRLEAGGANVVAHFDIGPPSIEYDELTDQGLVA